MKRILTTVLALMLMLTLCVPVFAANEDMQATTSNDGKITVNNAKVGETYKIFQLAMLESFSGTSYSYWLAPDVLGEDGETVVTKGWRDFFTTDAAKKFFNVSQAGYLTTTSETMEDTNIKKMVSDAFDYIEAHNIQPTDTKTAESTSVVFDNLPLGYYLVETTQGTICSIDTTDKEMTVNDKNSGPSVTKTVMDDEEGSDWGETNDADMFQTIRFREIVACKKGARNYVVHDTMSGMAFDADSLKIYLGSPATDDSNLVAASNYTLTTNVACGEGHTCTFHIAFTEAFCNTMTDSTRLNIYYTASLTENAVVGSTGNVNEVYMTYGNAQKTTSDTTTTYTYEFDLVKTDPNGVYLGGATFSLYDALTGGNRIDIVKEADGTYRIAKEGETGTVIELPDGTAVKISGLDGGTTYYLQEEVAPQGYNRLVARQAVEINESNLNITPDDDLTKYSGTEGGIRVINRTGTVLPETGGFGTTLFILIGTILVLGTGVLLATKLRMSKISD